MPSDLASRLRAVLPSVTLEMNARAAKLRASGVEVISFGVGEPDFEPPVHVLDGAKQAIDRGASKYTAVSGIPELKEAIGSSTERRRGYRPAPSEICVSVGAKHALFNVALALYEPGDEIVIPAPYWVSYPEQVRMMGATPVFVPTREEDGFRMSAAALHGALSPKTKAVLLCSPCNPTGAAYPKEALAALLDVLRTHDCFLVVDEIYADLVYDGFQHASTRAFAPDLAPRTIVIDGVSKTFAMTGWRIGWSIAPPPVAKAIDVIQGQSTTNAAAVAQHAACAALLGPMKDFETMRATFERRRNTMVEGLNGIPGIRCRKPEGAFYAFADVRGLLTKTFGGRTLQTDEDVAFLLLEVGHVVTVPGTPFGAPGYLRFSYAISEAQIEAGLARIRALLGTA